MARVHGMASRKVPEQASLSFDDVIREALLFLRHEMESRGVTILHRPDPASCRCSVDRTQLQQVIVNLAINAVQAMAQAGNDDRRIVISTVAQDAATLCCSVEDNGPGIAAEHVVGCSKAFSRPRTAGWAWDCRSAGRSSKRMAAGSAPKSTEREGHGADRGARFWFTLPIAPRRIAALRPPRRRLSATFPALQLCPGAAERTRRIGTPLYERLCWSGSGDQG